MRYESLTASSGPFDVFSLPDLAVGELQSPGTGPFFGQKKHLSEKGSAENMDLSPLPRDFAIPLGLAGDGAPLRIAQYHHWAICGLCSAGRNCRNEHDWDRSVFAETKVKIVRPHPLRIGCTTRISCHLVAGLGVGRSYLLEYWDSRFFYLFKCVEGTRVGSH
jgi:hypothetical protein